MLRTGNFSFCHSRRNLLHWERTTSGLEKARPRIYEILRKDRYRKHAHLLIFHTNLHSGRKPNPVGGSVFVWEKAKVQRPGL